MSELKTYWSNPPVPDVGVEGDTITARGTDPLVDTTGENGLTQLMWSDPPVSTPGGEETENSVSGLPKTPARYEPTEQPPGPPTLEKRNPGTIDKQ
jgi:hypothetical protein